MPLWFAALLGIVQGATEFLPISSTAHLRIVPALLGRPDPGAAYTAVIQLGTLVAVILYFRRELVDMTRGLLVQRGGEHARLALYVIAGTVPIGLAGITLKKYITGDLRSLWVVAGALIAVALALWVADRIARQDLRIDGLTLSHALVIGAAQACALVPGVSRSGATMAAALLLGLRRDDSARFSFLLSIPAIGAAGVFEMKDALRELGSSSIIPVAVGTIVAGVVGYLSIAWLLKFLRNRTLNGFVIYRTALGLFLFGLLLGGVIR